MQQISAPFVLNMWICEISNIRGRTGQDTELDVHAALHDCVALSPHEYILRRPSFQCSGNMVDVI